MHHRLTFSYSRTSARWIGAAAALGVTMLAAACAKRPVEPATTAAQPDNSAADRARADSIARADSLRRAEAARLQAEQDSLRALREREQREAAQNVDVMGVIGAPVYFDYDQSTLTDAAVNLLKAKVPILQSHSAMHIRITGHTDERGSSEYNLALGLRRAAEVKAYLVANGIDGGRVEITSMGEEMPAVQGHTEEAYSRNRRAEFIVISGGGGA